jgi:hypothetical protein
MADFEMDFQWWRASYEYIPPRIFGNTGDNRTRRPGDYTGRIRASGPAKPYRPDARLLDEAIAALLRIGDSRDYYRLPPEQFRAHLEQNVPAILKIATALGLLIHRSGPGEQEELVDWHLFADELRQLFEIAKRPPPVECRAIFGGLSIFMVSDHLGGPPTLALRPENLFTAIIFHAARSIAVGTTFQTCESCKLPFLSGGGRGRGKKKSGSQFCSDPCRWRYYNENRRKRA